MKLNVLKKISAGLLAFVMMLSLMPVTNVHADTPSLSEYLEISTVSGPHEVIKGNNYQGDTAITMLNLNWIQEVPHGIQNFEVIDGSLPTGTRYGATWGDTYQKSFILIGTPTKAGTYKFKLKVEIMVGSNRLSEISPEITVIVKGIESSLTVNSGNSEKTNYYEGDTVTITANTPEAGMQFKEWTVVSGGVTLDDPTSATTTFTMPDNAVEVTATYEDVSHTHTPATAWSKDDMNHWHECTANDGEKMDLASHTFGGWVIDTPATETTKGSKHRDCTVCGQRETVEIPATGVTPEKPVITTGAGSIHQISNGKDMTLTCSGKLEDLTGVYVDGKLVDGSNYTLKSGSTILTLKSSYLDTLSAGKHTLKFQYKDNVSAETDFTITAKAGETPKPSSPQTGDSSNLVIYAFLLLLSGCTVGAVTYKRKKSINN